MEDDILDIYNQIIEHGKDIKAAILEGNWERVDVLASHRELLFQKSGNYLSKHKKLAPELKEKVLQKLKEIKELDDENFKLIDEGKATLEKLRLKINIGQKALNAYQGTRKNFSRSLDEHV